MMDVAAVSAALSQAKTQETAGIMVLDKVMDVAVQNANAINRLISDSTDHVSDAHLGQYVDKYA
ncbi:MAG: YjfB family protein [Bacillota bacterium]|nr:YjfB family protein [Bacillota bacterium]